MFTYQRNNEQLKNIGINGRYRLLLDNEQMKTLKDEGFPRSKEIQYCKLGSDAYILANVVFHGEAFGIEREHNLLSNKTYWVLIQDEDLIHRVHQASRSPVQDCMRNLRQIRTQYCGYSSVEY